MMHTEQTPTTTSERCCPPADPAEWEGKTFVWRDEPFLRAQVRSFFHVPLHMERKVLRATAQIQGAGAAAERGLILEDVSSPWKTELLIHVKKPVPGGDMVTLSGTFLTKMFEGPYRNAPRWAKEMELYVIAKGLNPRKLYFAFLTCPRCAKAYGRNDVVVFAQSEPWGDQNS